MISARNLILTAAAGSLAALLAAFVFQQFGWAPCEMCLWQRWPHGGAALFGAIALLSSGLAQKSSTAFGALSALSAAALAAYHTGVERKWWEGPASCTGAGDDLGSLSAAHLVPGALPAENLVLCDTLTPFFLGLTMANWNLVLSLGFAMLWIKALRVV
jgi:disulfide bond formation protein DsbB